MVYGSFVYLCNITYLVFRSLFSVSFHFKIYFNHEFIYRIALVETLVIITLGVVRYNYKWHHGPYKRPKSKIDSPFLQPV